MLFGVLFALKTQNIIILLNLGSHVVKFIFYHQGHPVCEPCKARPEVRHCPTCRQRIVGRATLVEKIAAQVFEMDKVLNKIF